MQSHRNHYSPTEKPTKAKAGIGWLLLGALALLLPSIAWSATGKKTWTDTPDWASATSKQSITWTDVPGQIQLIKNPPNNFSTPYIYIPNSVSNTITQLSTKTGQKNWTISLNSIAAKSDPSRTTVDPNGDVWLGMRNTNKVAWIDKTGKIKKVVTVGQRPRAITVDLDGNIWVGCYDSNELYKLDGKTGAIILKVKQNCPYGAATDINGNIWVVNRCKHTLGKVSRDGKVLGSFPAHEGYGIATDAQGQVWVANLRNGCVHRFANDGRALGCIPLGSGCVNGRGVAVDGNGNVWVACSNTPLVVKVSSAGKVIGKTTQVGKAVVGLAVDVDGHLWAVSQGDATAAKINATTNALVGTYPTHGSGPYTYSDMTGFQFQIAARAAKGYWRAAHNTPCLAKWKSVSWNGKALPKTNIEVRVRTAHSKAALAVAKWSQPLTSGQKPTSPDGTWIEVEVALRTLDGNITPYVTDVTVEYDGGGQEICNGIDDDCDGIIDNIPGTKNPITRPCKTKCGDGITSCASGDWRVCTARYPSIEVCNGIDDDCDGEIDEGAGGSCPGGTLCNGGVCLRTCKQECPSGQDCTEINGQKLCVGRTPCDQLAAQCKQDGKICRNGRCVGACDGVICPDGFFCDGGHCEKDDCYNPKRPCPAEQICRNGKCEPNPCPKGTCPATEACRNGQCVPTCANVSCKVGESCQGGKCVADPCGGVNCPAGQVCAHGKCVGDPCAQSACRAGQSCVNGNCIDSPCAGVRCPDGQVCRLPNGDCFKQGGGGGVNPGPNPTPDAGPGPGPNPTPDSGPNPTPDNGTTTPDNSTNPGPNPNPNPGPTDPRCPQGGQWVNGQCQTTGPGGGRPGAGGCLCSASSVKSNPGPFFFLLLSIVLIAIGARRRKA